jgi:hypothetical protein
VVLTSYDPSIQLQASDVAYELHRQFRIPHWTIADFPHRPEHFLARLDYYEHCDATLRAGSMFVGAVTLMIHPWRLDTYTRPAEWFFT